MTARILNGIAIRDQIYGELRHEITALGAAGIRPGLAAVLVGDATPAGDDDRPLDPSTGVILVPAGVGAGGTAAAAVCG